MPSVFLASSCLVGKECSYDGKHRKCDALLEFLKNHQCVDVCPEVACGMSSPREIHEIVGGTGDDVLDGKARIVSASGVDRTKDFIRGAEEALEVAKKNGATCAILKAKSPSCGKGRVYDGTFSSILRDGHGVTCALLIRHGIKVFTENELGDIPDL